MLYALIGHVKTTRFTGGYYSLSIIEFTYFMYKIVNKATFIVVDTIKAYIKKSMKLINTTSLYEKEIYK